MYRLLTNGATDPSSWQLSTFFRTANHQAITAAPSAAMGFNDDLWVYFGTGRVFDNDDKADTSTQAFFGIRDDCLGGGVCGEVAGNDLLNVTNAVVRTDKTVSGVAGADTFSAMENYFKSATPFYTGWKMNLAGSGERALSKPRVLGGTVFFSSFTPNPDYCSMGGAGEFYALYFITGTAHYDPIIGETESHESLKSASLGKGLPASLGIHVGTRDGATGFVQTSTGNIVQLYVKPPLEFKSGTVSWRQP
jgi:type IV pilus assembly protein PilY1